MKHDYWTGRPHVPPDAPAGGQGGLPPPGGDLRPPGGHGRGDQRRPGRRHQHQGGGRGKNFFYMLKFPLFIYNFYL